MTILAPIDHSTFVPKWLLVDGYAPLATYYDVLTSPVWTDDELTAWAPPPDIPVSQWADENRVLLSKTSRRAGPWRTDFTPYLGPIMDAYKLDWLHHLVFCAGTQLGKTETVYNILGYIIDHEPYPTLFMGPREDDVKLASKSRIQPMIESCESLRAKIPVKAATGAYDRSKYKTLEMEFPGMMLYFAGANSLAGLASKPCRNVIRDERDKMTTKLADGTDAASKSDERTKDYWDIRKLLDVSSPTFEHQGILRELAKCDIIQVIHHPCPHCGQLIRLYPTQVRYDAPSDHPKRAAIAKSTAYYECQRCEGRIENKHRQRMIAGYQYVAQRNITFGIENEGKNIPLTDVDDLDFAPESMGFWVSSLSSPILTWGDIAGAWVTANIHRDETGETGPLQTVINDWFGEPWRDGVKVSSADIVTGRKKERDPLIVPSWATALTCGIDAQKFGMWFSVWAWSQSYRSALIHYGFLPNHDELLKLVFGTDFAVESSDQRMMIWRAGMDIGGGEDSVYDEEWTKTEETLQFIRANGQGVINAVKGMSVNRSPGVVVKHSVLDKMPGGSLIVGGLNLYLLDTEVLKDLIFWRLSQHDADPQPVELHSQVLDDFVLQMTAEEKERTKGGRLEYVRKRKDNHLLDTCVYASGCAHFQWLGGVQILGQPIYSRLAVPVKKPSSLVGETGGLQGMRANLHNFQRPDWLQGRR